MQFARVQFVERRLYQPEQCLRFDRQLAMQDTARHRQSQRHDVLLGFTAITQTRSSEFLNASRQLQLHRFHLPGQALAPRRLPFLEASLMGRGDKLFGIGRRTGAIRRARFSDVARKQLAIASDGR
jgi:hypothetical protein